MWTMWRRPSPIRWRGGEGGRGTINSPHRSRRWLLDRLQQCVQRLFREAVCIFDDRDLPAPAGRRKCGAGYELAGLGNAVGEARGGDDLDIGVRPCHRGVALVAVTATGVEALQCSCECTRSNGPTGPGRPGEQPRMRHGCRAADCCCPQHLDDLGLADQSAEDVVVAHACHTEESESSA